MSKCFFLPLAYFFFSLQAQDSPRSTSARNEKARQGCNRTLPAENASPDADTDRKERCTTQGTQNRGRANDYHNHTGSRAPTTGQAHAERGEKTCELYTCGPKGRKGATVHRRAQEAEKASYRTQPGSLEKRRDRNPCTAELHKARSRKMIKQGEKPAAPKGAPTQPERNRTETTTAQALTGVRWTIGARGRRPSQGRARTLQRRPTQGPAENAGTPPPGKTRSAGV